MGSIYLTRVVYISLSRKKEQQEENDVTRCIKHYIEQIERRFDGNLGMASQTRLSTAAAAGKDEV